MAAQDSGLPPSPAAPPPTPDQPSACGQLGEAGLCVAGSVWRPWWRAPRFLAVLFAPFLIWAAQLCSMSPELSVWCLLSWVPACVAGALAGASEGEGWAREQGLVPWLSPGSRLGQEVGLGLCRVSRTWSRAGPLVPGRGSTQGAGFSSAGAPQPPVLSLRELPQLCSRAGP